MCMLLKEFHDIKKEFLTYINVERNLSAHTQRAYHSDLEQFQEFWKNIDVQDKIPHSMRQALERFLVMLYHKKITKSSIARKLSCFKSFEKFSQTRGIQLSLNLARPKVDKKLPNFLSVDEIFYLLDSVKNEELDTQRPYRDKGILELFYATGIRCSELVNIRLADIDLENKTIRIFGKGKKERIVLFGNKAKEKLMLYLEHERGPRTSDTEFLFLNYRNEPLTTRSVQRILEIFRKFLKGGKRITPHNIRHSFATHLLNQGADLRVVQELLGHKTLSSTEIYTHVSAVELKTMCDTLHPMNTTIKKPKQS